MSESNQDPEGSFINRLRVVKGNSLSTMDKNLNLLNEKVDKLLHFQEDLTGKLQKVNEGIDDLGRGLHKLTILQIPADQVAGVKNVLQSENSVDQLDPQIPCAEILTFLKATNQDDSKYRERLDKLERMVDSVEKVVKCLGEMFKNSKVVDFILKGGAPWWKGSPIEILEETKDKPEEKGAKGKHVPTNKGIQRDGKNSLEADKREKKLGGCDGACEKVNLASEALFKTDSSPCMKENLSQPETMEAPGQANSSEGSQKPKDSGVSAGFQDNGPSCINGGSLTGGQSVAQVPGMENSLTKHTNRKTKQSENSIPQLGSAAGVMMPSTSKSGVEVIRTRLSINVQMSVAQEKTGKNKEGSAGIQGSKSVGVSGPLTPPLVGEGAKHLPDVCKAKQLSKSTRTEATKEIKATKPSNKQDTQMVKLVSPSQPLPKAEGKTEIKSKTVLCLSSVAKDSGRDPGSKVKSPKEASKLRKDSMTDGKSACGDSSSISVGRQERRPSQAAGKATEDVPSLGAGKVEEFVIDDSPPPPAPFEHRIVSIKQTELTACYSVCHHEVLGGGRFGEVHKCTEKLTGLCLAAKIIKVKAAKEREEVKNEINIMNQLNHVNLIQLYDAFESKNNLTLIMEYVDGGELFDRITDESYNLTELDAILFTKQICEGICYLHQQYILHLDLKPENILCVNLTGNQIKIIDFGLARRYKPREKLKVNFGTPEFLAPEVVNYDFVSFPTDMWSVGIIAYMLLSGLSPFLGETDTETMNYIVNCSWDFDAEAFEQVSEEAKDFVSRLLVKEKSGRTSAANCLKHEWLTDLPGKAKKYKARLKSQLLLQRYMAHRKWKKHFYVVAAANRLRRFPSMSENPV
uniref:Myosin light chain kinase 3 n=1 Tax=Salvator merianae TaxID=96440 RepID=A0A8D0BMC4_SALMN